MKRGAASFVPTDVAGLAGWYDFSDATTLYTDAGTTLVSADGDLIHQANDKSGNGRHVIQATSGVRPAYKTAIQNGKSVSRYDGARRLRVASLTLNQPNTVFVVCKWNGAAGNNQIVTDGSVSNQNAFYVPAGGTTLNMYGGLVGAAATNITAAWRIFVAKFNTTASQAWVDGGAPHLASFNVGSQNPNAITIGDDGSGGGFFIGDVGTVLWYNANVSLANINLIGDYLDGPWGLTWTTAT